MSPDVVCRTAAGFASSRSRMPSQGMSPISLDRQLPVRSPIVKFSPKTAPAVKLAPSQPGILLDNWPNSGIMEPQAAPSACANAPSIWNAPTSLPRLMRPFAMRWSFIFHVFKRRTVLAPRRSLSMRLSVQKGRQSPSGWLNPDRPNNVLALVNRTGRRQQTLEPFPFCD